MLTSACRAPLHANSLSLICLRHSGSDQVQTANITNLRILDSNGGRSSSGMSGPCLLPRREPRQEAPLHRRPHALPFIVNPAVGAGAALLAHLVVRLQRAACRALPLVEDAAVVGLAAPMWVRSIAAAKESTIGPVEGAADSVAEQTLHQH